MTTGSAKIIQGACQVELEQTPESLHAYAVLDGVEINPGDTVLLHGAPSGIGFGERGLFDCHFTVHRANWLMRAWTQLTGLFEITELYEVGFLPKEMS
jgi:hypothetical protein